MSLLVPRATTIQAAPLPGALPAHFGIGLAAAPGSSGIYGWLPNSGIPWDYAYQYLSGGTNTGTGWETWNSSGQFPLYYAQGAASHGYLPVFRYYELLQSTGPCGSCGEAQKDLANLNSTSTMAAYYANFALLMKRLGSGSYGGIQGFGKTAIVHVEPDLSGYAENAVRSSANCYGYCSGQGSNPAYLRAAVASSGYAAVAAYPDTYQGFNWALLHLRDLYAPNVLLAFHISDWATGTDVGQSTSGTLDVTTLGAAAGTFAAQAGITGVPAGTSSYDLLFNDVSDRDAAYYKYVYNNPNVWWDRLNVSFPNFHRWEAYIGAATKAAGRSLIVWQIPVGNQYYATENNTDGHYQDNRVEYFFGHLQELAQVGIIGLLFGPGNGGSTEYYDAKGDGITNPPAFCTSDGLSSGQICNNHQSTYADDDGGYLRLQANAYYANGPLALGSSSSSSSSTSSSLTSSSSSSTTTSTSPSSTASSSTATTTTTKSTFTSTSTTTSASAAAPSFQQSTTVSPATVAPGGSVTIRTTLTDMGGALSNGIVDLEVYNAAGQKVGQQSTSGQSLGVNQSAAYTYVWTAPQSAGTYTIKVGVFGGNWNPLYYWNNGAATVSVAAPTFSVSGVASPSTVAPGTAVTFTATVTDTGATLNDGVVDIEIYDAAGQKVGQQFFTGQKLATGNPGAYRYAWVAPSSSGTYTMKVGIFGPNWTPLYSWDNSAATVGVN